jgi:Arc/MetJ-type ribon-helix-helix transcriptional regulator
MRKTAKFAISMPESEFRGIESLRRKAGKTRSQFVREAIRAWKAGSGRRGPEQQGSTGNGRASLSVREEANRYGSQPSPDLVGQAERKRRAIAVAGRFASEAGDLSVGHDRYLGDGDLETEIAKGQGAPGNVPAKDGKKNGRKSSESKL